VIDPALPSSERLTSLSPTAFEAVRLCHLQGAFRQQGSGSPTSRNPAQVLGDLCHEVLGELVNTGAIREERWAEALDPLWQRVADRTAQKVHQAPHEPSLTGAPDHWPGYVIKRARLAKAARRLHDLLDRMDDGAEFMSEIPLSSADGRLQGRPDLIVRGATQTWIVDYKTGSVVDDDGVTPRPTYVRQLHFYALLERENAGRWPTHGFLIPLNGPVLEVAIDPAASSGIGRDALQVIDSFNAVVPGVQPAAPGPSACHYCAWVTRCGPFWEACDSSWDASIVAVAGVVQSAVRTAIGGVSLVLDVHAGSVDAASIVVRNVSLAEHPSVAEVSEGTEIALVNLRRLNRSDEFALPPWGTLGIRAPQA
jgi:RecB family exonuclease